MIIYNVTINVESLIEKEWLQWMKETHIPEVLATGCFTEHKFLKLLNESPDAQGATYAVQYFANGISSLNVYLDKYGPDLEQKTIQKYQEKCLMFRTFLEEV